MALAVKVSASDTGTPGVFVITVDVSPLPLASSAALQESWVHFYRQMLYLGGGEAASHVQMRTENHNKPNLHPSIHASEHVPSSCIRRPGYFALRAP